MLKEIQSNQQIIIQNLGNLNRKTDELENSIEMIRNDEGEIKEFQTKIADAYERFVNRK